MAKRMFCEIWEVDRGTQDDKCGGASYCGTPIAYEIVLPKEFHQHGKPVPKLFACAAHLHRQLIMAQQLCVEKREQIKIATGL